VKATKSERKSLVSVVVQNPLAYPQQTVLFAHDVEGGQDLGYITLDLSVLVEHCRVVRGVRGERVSESSRVRKRANGEIKERAPSTPPFSLTVRKSMKSPVG
jgi:hypothetical protein